jgi:succinyl-diaminopimelate desuccinylase
VEALQESAWWQGRQARLGPDLRAELRTGELGTEVVVHGKAAHGGVNLEGGRNALVGLARLMEGRLPVGGADDLLAFTRLMGQDLYGKALGLPRDPVFGPMTVNPALLKLEKTGAHRLFINLRRTPALSNQALKARLEQLVTDFNARTGARLRSGGYWEDEVLAFDPYAKVVRRLLKAYARGAGQAEGPNISGGGTYAKRLPNAIAFGMWFPGSGPYPGHDVDERIPVKDLHRGVHVLVETLGDLACSKPMVEPFRP